MDITNYYANKKNYGGKRSLSAIKYIVIHYTGNDGDSDTGNAKYFRNNVVEVSAHYFVDDDSITRSVPDNYIAWHCGSNKYYCNVRNTNSIGIEMCDTNKNGKYDLSAKTRANVISLVKTLMKKYNIPIANVVRHYDVSHKCCPAYFVNDTKAWNKFKSDIIGTTKTYKPYTGRFPVLPKRGYFKRGDSGSEVRSLQALLNWLGYKIAVDGDFGEKTEASVKSYQKLYKLEVDGLFGKASLAKAKRIKK
jgi:N-acetylmuramoyl-L-alanine amidase